MPEVTYLLRRRLGSAVEAAFAGACARGELAIEPLESGDLARAAEIMGTYPDLGFVDSTVVAIAERLDLESLVTTDRRHFGAVRPRHRERFELLP